MENINFFSVIPSTVMFDVNLSSSAKLFYALISSLTNEKGYCFATNKYFSERFNAPLTTISNWLSELVSQEHIQVEISKEHGNKRKIYLSLKMGIPIPKNGDTYSQKTESTPYYVNNKIDNSIVPPLNQSELFSEIPKKEKNHLFKNSEFFDIEKFRAKFSTEISAGVDVDHYYHSVLNWSEAGGKKKINWISTAKNFMLGDKKSGKLMMLTSSKIKLQDTAEMVATWNKYN